jgi:hypothetical protein
MILGAEVARPQKIGIGDLWRLNKGVEPAAQPPSGELWLREIKHDGFRVIARKSGQRVKLYKPSWQ